MANLFRKVGHDVERWRFLSSDRCTGNIKSVLTHVHSNPLSYGRLCHRNVVTEVTLTLLLFLLQMPLHNRRSGVLHRSPPVAILKSTSTSLITCRSILWCCIIEPLFFFQIFSFPPFCPLWLLYLYYKIYKARAHNSRLFALISPQFWTCRCEAFFRYEYE